MESMEAEHCSMQGHNVEFVTSNYQVTTCPEKEWAIVVAGNKEAADMRHKRVIPELAECKKKNDANLIEEELISVIMYTGPMVSIFIYSFPHFGDDQCDIVCVCSVSGLQRCSSQISSLYFEGLQQLRHYHLCALQQCEQAGKGSEAPRWNTVVQRTRKDG